MLTFQTFSDNMKLHIYRNLQKNVDVFGHLLQETPCGAIPRKRPRDMTKISILDGSLLTVRTCELPVVWSYVHYNKVSLY